jgi:hypothetical protein
MSALIIFNAMNITSDFIISGDKTFHKIQFMPFVYRFNTNLQLFMHIILLCFLGDLLRAEVKSGTPLGNKIKDVISKGQLVSDEIVCEMIDKNLS